SFELSNNNRARIRLIHSLMEGLRFDFPRYRKYRDEVDKLMIDPALRWEYLKLFAEGLDQSGEKSAAYFEYLKLFDIADAVKFDELNDETLSTLPQAWIPTRLDEIYRSASAADRKSFDEEIERRWGSVEKLTDAKILFRFAHEFAGHPLSWIARKRGIDLAKSSRSAIQRELELSALAEAPQPTISGYAIAEWTRLLMDRNRFVDAQTLLKRLEAEYADIECHPGQSGRQLATAWKEEIAKNASDEVTGQWPTGRIRIERRERVQTELTPQYYPIPFDESPSPFFEGWVMEMDQQRANIRARDQFGRLRWTLPLLETSFVVPDVRGNSVKAWGHLLVFSLTNGFLVVDTLNSESRPKVLWQKPLIEHSRNPRIDQGIQSADHIGAGGQRRQRLFDSQGKPIGRVGPVNHSSLIYQVGRQIFAADIFTGETLWTRRDVFPGSRLFGNHDVAVAVSLDNSQTLVLNARSGALINQLIIPSDYYQLQLHGQHALIWEHEALPQSLYLLDLVTGQNVWEHQFRDAVQVAMIETDEIAVIDERGELTIYRIDDGTIRLTHPLPLKNELHEFLVLRNDEQYLLLTNVEPREKKLQRTFAVSQASDMINGPVFSFSRESGALQWSSHIEFQQFDLNQTRHLPILVFFCKRYELSPQGLSIVRPQFAVLILDRRNGKICFEEEWAEVIGDVKVVPQMTPQVDRQRIVVDLNRSIIELQFTDEAETEPPATDAKEPDAKSPDAQKSESP
ncbi:MAG: hypothetical protein ACKVT0_00550, partial [Planctomycetaceae bacterium]